MLCILDFRYTFLSEYLTNLNLFFSYLKKLSAIAHNFDEFSSSILFKKRIFV